MKLCAAAAILLCLASALSPAQAADAMESPQCQAARASLDAVLNDRTVSESVLKRQLSQARQRAARECFGTGTAPGERSGAPFAPQAVPPPTITPASRPPAPVLAEPPPPLPIPRPAVITTCDVSGCWDSEGRRLNHMGPILIGPRGPCSIQGGAVNCP
ncbi:MAG TPA: hypothetical protein VLI46_09795 [Ramlibacter sp.]|nr:hypothetical protein [Ramlibacter sp.]